MDTTELHYVTYDPDAIYKEMLVAYMDAGGDVLYPGDEKEMLLHAVQAILVKAFAGVDNALRMATLRYAAGDYLDVYGKARNCSRIQAQAATATVEIKCSATGKSGTIEAGTTLTADGEHLYALDEDFTLTGYEQTTRVTVTAEESGSAGNALLSGAQMQFLAPQEGVSSVYCVADAEGGQEAEDDDTYRERIRLYGLATVTTGPEQQYEAKAKAVTSEILDAKVLNAGGGKVNIVLLLADDTGASAIMENVEEALSAEDVRPLTDEVNVTLATDIPYKLVLRYKADTKENISSAIMEAVESYQEWQDNTIGRAFNPDRLMAAAYQAGATRVIWGSESGFNGTGSMEYTEIAEDAHCAGTITLEVIAS